MKDRYLKFIKSVYTIPSISHDGHKMIGGAHKRIHFKKGEVIFRNGEIAKDYILIESGILRKYVIDGNGNEVTTKFHSAGDFSIVMLSFFHQLPSSENIAAITDGVGWKISFTGFMDLLKLVKGLGEWRRKWMADQLFISEQRSVDILVKTATERYVELLSSDPELVEQIPLKYLASYLGVTNSSLSRIRKRVLKN